MTKSFASYFTNGYYFYSFSVTLKQNNVFSVLFVKQASVFLHKIMV